MYHRQQNWTPKQPLQRKLQHQRPLSLSDRPEDLTRSSRNSSFQTQEWPSQSQMQSRGVADGQGRPLRLHPQGSRQVFPKS